MQITNTIILATLNLKGLNLLDKEKISVQKLYNTANQNNSVSYLHCNYSVFIESKFVHVEKLFIFILFRKGLQAKLN